LRISRHVIARLTKSAGPFAKRGQELFAIAFQLAVCIGHVHLDRVSPAGANVLASTESPSDEVNSASPSGHEDLADDLRPICT
jgi:hypothetical protein